MFIPDLLPLLECGLRASLPLGVAWLAVRLASRASAATRHFIWAFAIAMALLLPTRTFVGTRWNIATPAPFVQLASTTRATLAPRGPSNTPGPAQPLPIVHKPEQPRSRPFPARTIVAFTWLVGAMAVLFYDFVGHIAGWRLYRTARRNQATQFGPNLLERELNLDAILIAISSEISVPVVLHLWRPVIIMPTASREWSQTRIRSVLLHEFAHVKRRDLHVQTMVQFACALYWFNPLVWFAAVQLRNECEQACDDFVLRVGASRTEYATDLFEIARQGSAVGAPRFAIGLAERRSQLERRLTAILNPLTRRDAMTFASKCAIAVPLLLVAASSGALQLTAKSLNLPLQALHSSPGVLPVESEKNTPVSDGAEHSSSYRDDQGRQSDFHWTAHLREQQTIEVHLGRGSIRVLPSTDETVRVDARTDTPGGSRIVVVPTSSGVKFCDRTTEKNDAHDYCEPTRKSTQMPQSEPATQFTIYIPAGLSFAGSTVVGDITAQYPLADSNLATLNGNITLQLAPDQAASFDGNVIAGQIQSDIPLTDNAPPLPNGEKAMDTPRIVHSEVGTGGPHLSAAVVNGDIRVLRRSTE